MTVSSFRYRAVDLSNQTRSGLVEAASRAEALAELAGRGLTVTELVAVQAPREIPTEKQSRRFLDPSPSLNDIQTLTAEWARCLDVGLTIADAVAISTEGRAGTKLGRTMETIQTSLRRGGSLHQALAQHTPRLPPATLALIEVGERSGQLAPTLSRLSERLGHQRRLRSEIRSALVYPAFVVLTAVGVVVILLQEVVPAIDDIIGDRQEALPLTAQFVLQASRMYREHAFEIAAGVGLLATLILSLVLHPAMRPVLDRVRLGIPYVSSLLLANDAAQFARALAAQVGGGVPIGRATRLAVTALALEPMRTSARNLERKLSEGLALSEAVITDLPHLPRELARFARVGEQTGRLAILLEHVAEILEERARRQTRTLTSLVTPAITIGLGLLVGFIVLSLMNAIIGLNTVALQ